MLDSKIIKIVNRPLNLMAGILKKFRVNKDALTLTGFALGVLAMILIIFKAYIPALVLIAMNRIFDGLDGALARITKISDAGGFLDITLDFIFYSGIVFAFALAEPEANSIFACLLIFSFVGTGSSFLAFSVMAEKNKIKSIKYPNKSLYYLGGLTEGTETIFIFILFCIFPDFFPWLAIIFSVLCWLTIVSRVYVGYTILTRSASPGQNYE